MKNSLYCTKIHTYTYIYICVCVCVCVDMHADTYAACLCIIPTNCNLVLLRPHNRYSYKIYVIWKINSTSCMWVPWVAEKCQFISNLPPNHAMAEIPGCIIILWQTSGFNPRPVHVEFLVDEVTVEQVLLKVHQFPMSVSFCQSPSSFINPM